MRKVGGDKAADGFLAPRGAGDALKMTSGERTQRRIAQPNFWNRQGENTLDRATAMMPNLLYERLDEIGSDFAVIYPTAGLRLPRIKDDETRRAVIRAYNIVSAEYFRDFSDRMTPAAIIPMHTPEEAIDELEFVTKQLGSKVGMFGSDLPRPVPPLRPRTTSRAASRSGTTCSASTAPMITTRSGQKCVELGIAPTFHSGSSSQGLRLSPTNFVYNHIGHFAAAGHAVAKGIFLGGVTRRFPRAQFRLSRRRRRLGRAAIRRSDRALGAAQRQGARTHGPGKARPQAADGPGREARLRRHRRGVARARRLARSRGAFDRRARRTRRFRRLQDHPQGGLGRPLRQALLLRLRGRRPDERHAPSAAPTRSARSSTRSTAPISGIST